MKIVKIQGIIIKEVNTGEADKIVTIFTKKLGKIQAVARGARRPNSRLIAGSQLLCYSDFVLQKGKEMYEMKSCEVIESFYNIRYYLDKLTYASHMVDLVTEVSEENLSYPKVLQLFLNTLYVLSTKDKNPELLIRIFEIRLMSIVGFEPQVIECLGCKKVDTQIYFSAKMGGIICSECRNLDKSAIKISESTLNTIRFIIYCEMNKLFSFDVGDNVLDELKKVSQEFYKVNINKHFQKLEFLKTLDIGENNG